jgi:hypothetical protein
MRAPTVSPEKLFHEELARLLRALGIPRRY